MIKVQVPALKPKWYEITSQNDEINLQCRNKLGPSFVNCKFVSISSNLPEYIFVYTLAKWQNWNEDQNDDYNHTNTAKQSHDEGKNGKENYCPKCVFIVLNVICVNVNCVTDQLVKEEDIHEACERKVAEQLIWILCLDSDGLKQEEYLANF